MIELHLRNKIMSLQHNLYITIEHSNIDCLVNTLSDISFNTLFNSLYESLGHNIDCIDEVSKL
jgi:hypothetical protein